MVQGPKKKKKKAQLSIYTTKYKKFNLYNMCKYIGYCTVKYYFIYSIKLIQII